MSSDFFLGFFYWFLCKSTYLLSSHLVGNKMTELEINQTIHEARGL